MLDGEKTPDVKVPGLNTHPWSVLSLSGGEVKGDIVKYMRDNFILPHQFRAEVNKILTPGTILLATKESSTKDTRSGVMAIGVPDEDPDKKE